MAVPLVPGPGLGDANAAQKSMSTLLKNQCDFAQFLLNQNTLAHVVGSLPARAPRSWCRSRGMIALLPLDLPTTLPAPCLGAIRRQMRVWSGQALPSTISTPPVLPADIPGISPTSLLVSPHGAFLRYFGIHTTWHAQSQLVCDRLSLSIVPALLGRRSRPSAPPW